MDELFRSKKHRQHIISLLRYPPESIGAYMDSEVVTLQKERTLKECVAYLKQLHKTYDLSDMIYVTDKNYLLMGYVTLDKLIFNDQDSLLSTITRKCRVVIKITEDREVAVNRMHDMEVVSAPVVDKHNHFLGIITAHDMVEIIQKEDSEDMYKRFGLSAMEASYFETPLWKLIAQRGMWLVGLLFLQSLSSLILGHYEGLIKEYTMITVFIGMLIATGGNAGNQSSTLVIRGLTLREIVYRNAYKVCFRELVVALILGFILSAVAAWRVYLLYPDMKGVTIIALSSFIIVVVSTFLGTITPMILKACRIDPAYSAAPFLATIMDIIGVAIFCFIFSRMIA